MVICAIFVSSAARAGIDTLRGLIGLLPDDLIRVSSSGISIADSVLFDENGLTIGGVRVDFDEIGEMVSGTMDAAGTLISGEMAGGFYQTLDVTESGFAQNRYAFDAATHRSLDIDVSHCDVVIAGGDVDKIVVDVLESADYAYTFSTSDNALVIAEPKRSKRSPTYTGLAMVIYLPTDFSGEIDLATTDGDVKIGALSLSDALSVATSDGDVELFDLEAGEISASATSGRMTLANLSAMEIDAATTGEKISMSELTVKRLSASTSRASIDFSRLFGEKFEFSTSGGDISGSILGAQGLFSIVTETDGAAYPPTAENSRAQYSLRAETTGGDINVRFVE